MEFFSCIWKNEWSPAIIMGIISPIIALGISVYFGITGPKLVKKNRIEETFEVLKNQIIYLELHSSQFNMLINQFIVFVINNAKKHKSKKRFKKIDLCLFTNDKKKRKHKTSLYEVVLSFTNVKVKRTIEEIRENRMYLYILMTNTDIKKITYIKFYIIFKTLCMEDLKEIKKTFND